jgi:hypothetical protein
MVDDSGKTNQPSDFQEVFRAELDQIRERHNAMGRAQIGAGTNDPTTELELTGLACSGGGIRSASFCLGVLQGLQSKSVIDKMDYLSTVSGGGYIGTTLTIGLSRRGEFPFGRLDSERRDTPEVRHLRDNSRYLIQNGIFSIMSAAVIYLRGIAVGVLVILPILLLGAAVLIALNWDTDELARTNVLDFEVPEFFTGSRIPFTLALLCFMAALVTAYAIVVSVVPIARANVRRLAARIAAVVFLVCAGIMLLEFHTVLLRLVFEDGYWIMPPDGGDGEAPPLQVFKTVYDTALTFALYVAPLVLAVIPFLKPLIATATTGAAGSWGGEAKKIASRVLLLLAAAVVPVLLWLVMMQLAYWGTAIGGAGWLHAPVALQDLFGEPDGRWKVPAIYALAAIACMALWPILSVNSNSLHQLYRDRLGRAFLIKRNPDDEIELDDNFQLTDIDPRLGPYHLINAALNIPGSDFANKRGRNADFFIFSRGYVGSEATGYVDTKKATSEVDGLNIGTAMAISGAAAAPNMGMASIRPLSPTIAFLNIRLGRWMRHPHVIALNSEKRKIRRGNNDNLAKRIWINLRSSPWAHHLLYEAFSKSGVSLKKKTGRPPARNSFIFLTDGGHIDNLGIYELLRRRCKLIIAIDAEADPDLDAASLTQVERFARIDLNVSVQLNWEAIGERTRAVSASNRHAPTRPTKGPHVAVGRIIYPPLDPGGTPEEGVLVYIKASLTGDENDYVTAYRASNPRFPHETTADQLFSEEQFEVYRALGEHIARRFLSGADQVAAYAQDRAAVLATLKQVLPNVSAR